MSTSRTRRPNATAPRTGLELLGSLTRCVGRALGMQSSSAIVETLEPRQMLSVTLPEQASWHEWGGGQVAAKNGSYLLTFDDRMSSDNAKLLAADVARALNIRAWDFASLARGRAATFTTDQVLSTQDARRAAALVPGLSWIEPNQVYQSTRAPNDPLYGDQQHHNNVGQTVQGVTGTIGADVSSQEAWDITIGTRDVVVAVIDTGIQLNHPDLRDNIWVNPGEIAGDGIDNDGNGFIDDINGFDFGEQDNDPNDRQGHGSQVAGVIGARGDNGIGIAGVAWNVSLMALKIADRFGNLTAAAIVAAHDYATQMRTDFGIRVEVSNNSYGAYGAAEEFYEEIDGIFIAEREAIRGFINSGGVFVAAAGNDSFDNDSNFTSFPASYDVPGIIAVASTTNVDTLSGFSNFGVARVDLAAPGQNVLTTNNTDGYVRATGTSFASPLVAGAVALMKTVRPNASAVEIRNALINSSDVLPGLQNRVVSGGRVNVARALQLLSVDGPLVRGFSPGLTTTQIDQTTGNPLNTLRVTFSEPVDPALLSAPGVQVIGAGVNGVFNTGATGPVLGDDVNVPVTNVSIVSGTGNRVVQVTLNVAGFAGQALPIDNYRVSLRNANFRDTSGNRLNGGLATGSDEVLSFAVLANSGVSEPNDTRAVATNLGNFTASGTGGITGVAIGDGAAGVLDVDMYRIDMARGGSIRAEVVARRLQAGSTLDSYLRLFNAQGVEIASNDQFFGQDSAIDFFVPTGGTYYLGVSGFSNFTYDVDVPSSGTTQSTGAYNLTLEVTLASDDVATYDRATFSPGAEPQFPLNIPRGGELPKGSGQPNPGPSGTQGTTTAQIVIPDNRSIQDLNLNLSVRHTAVGDLRIELIGPDNTTVRLFGPASGPPTYGFSSDNLGTFDASGNPIARTIFDDESPIAVSAGASPYAGTFRGEQPLSAFDGKVAAGVWTLRIVDTRAGDSGQLVDWSLQFTFASNISGPFESNDTPSTATAPTFTGTIGASTRTGFLGDGGFGALDRDFYRVQAEQGDTLSARITQSAVQSAIRLFDDQGTQISLSIGTAGPAQINNYVFSRAGTYYLAVSHAVNTEYNPAVVATGVSMPSTGTYTLVYSVTGGVSDPTTAIAGSVLGTTVGVNGTLSGTDTSYRGLTLQQGTRTIEFLPQLAANDTRVSSFVGAAVDGRGFVNSTRETQQPFQLLAQSDTFNGRVLARTQLSGVRIDRAVTVGQNDRFLVIDVNFTNTTLGAIPGVTWMEGLNPDHGRSLVGGNATLNDITNSGRAARATFLGTEFEGGVTLALVAAPGAVPAQARVLDADQTFRDAGVLAAQPVTDPNGSSSDSQLALTFNVGTLAPGQTTSVRYFVFVEASSGGTAPTSNQAVDAQIALLDAGTGSGHLAPTPGGSALETLSDGSQARTLPYRVYYPEGFWGPNIFTLIPIANPHDQPANVVVIQRFDAVPDAQRDRIVASVQIAPRSRAGVEVNLPDLYQNVIRNLPQADRAYALEIRSDLPVAATFSYYDLVQISAGPVAVGESFTSQAGQVWTMTGVEQRPGVNSIVVFQNVSGSFAKATVRLVNEATGQTFRATRDIGAFGRSGVFLGENNAGIRFDDESTTAIEDVTLPAGVYSVIITADRPIVAAKTTYDSVQREASGAIANIGLGATSGVVPEGQQGIRSTGANSEVVSVLNAGSTIANVEFSFLFANGSTYRTVLDVPAGRAGSLRVGALPSFPTGQPYSVFYTSNTAVSISSTSPVQQRSNVSGLLTTDAFALTGSTRASTFWGFGEGFRPGDNSRWGPAQARHPGLTENLRLYNPGADAITVEITVTFEDGTEVIRRTIPGRRVTEFDIYSFIPQQRYAVNTAFGLFVKSPTPIVASMNHFDLLFPGGFSTLGTPLGRTSAIT